MAGKRSAKVCPKETVNDSHPPGPRIHPTRSSGRKRVATMKVRTPKQLFNGKVEKGAAISKANRQRDNNISVEKLGPADAPAAQLDTMEDSANLISRGHHRNSHQHTTDNEVAERNMIRDCTMINTVKDPRREVGSVPDDYPSDDGDKNELAAGGAAANSRVAGGSLSSGLPSVGRVAGDGVPCAFLKIIRSTESRPANGQTSGCQMKDNAQTGKKITGDHTMNHPKHGLEAGSNLSKCLSYQVDSVPAKDKHSIFPGSAPRRGSKEAMTRKNVSLRGPTTLPPDTVKKRTITNDDKKNTGCGNRQMETTPIHQTARNASRVRPPRNKEPEEDQSKHSVRERLSKKSPIKSILKPSGQAGRTRQPSLRRDPTDAIGLERNEDEGK